MLPPVNPVIHRQNPDFHRLYAHLTSAKLNSNGTTIQSDPAKSREDIKDTLRSAQMTSAKSDILRRSLSHVAATATELPDELLEVIDIVAAQLTNRLVAEDLELLQGEVEYFVNHLQSIGDVVSEHLVVRALELAKVIHPHETSLSKARASIAALGSYMSNQRDELSAVHLSLPAQSLKLVDTGSILISAYAQALDTSIRLLEQTVHGVSARSNKAHADHLAAVAASLAAKLQLMKHEAYAAIYTPEASSALQAYSQHLNATKARLRERKKTALASVAHYESEGDDMRNLASRYTRTLKEIETTKADIKRLGGDLDAS
ncbi:MAG: hypothetical protein M1825_002866 [Sarcosagium campestre]|nr:MAG: hypothetical protein M1825_002866 [Sarcosagium campestre]